MSHVSAMMSATVSNVDAISQPLVAWAGTNIRGTVSQVRRGFAPGPHQGALPLGAPPRGIAPWNHSFWLGGEEARPGPRTVTVAPLPTQPMDGLQRASPFAGVQGQGPWRVRGGSPASPPGTSTATAAF